MAVLAVVRDEPDKVAEYVALVRALESVAYC